MAPDNISTETNKMDDNKSNGTVLIVDDEYTTIDLLMAILKPYDYNLIGAQSGKEALDIIQKEKVDLVLLDLMMPEMNGYDVCKAIKGDKNTRAIPVLVISALSEVQDNIKAMEVGAEGFLAKPFNNKLVVVYVQTLIKVKKLTDELIKLYQLKDDLTRMIVHDLKNPLISAVGFINLSIKEKNLDKIKWYLSIIKNSVADALNFIEDLHDITRLENNKFTLNKSDENIYLMIADIIDAMTPLFKKRGLTTKFVSDCNLRHYIDPQVFKRVMQNIFTNAAKYANKNSTIMIYASIKNNLLRVQVSNEGDVIPEEYRLKIFEKFGQVEIMQMGGNVGSGLGLAFCKMAVKAHNGNIWVESPAVEFDDGTTIIFEIL